MSNPTINLAAILTTEEYERAFVICADNLCHARLKTEIILPAMDRINAATGQENDPDYMAYLLEFLLGQSK